MLQEQLAPVRTNPNGESEVLPSAVLQNIPLRLQHLGVRVPAIKLMVLKELESDPRWRGLLSSLLYWPHGRFLRVG